MPEGHTLHRLARQQDELFAGRPVHVTSPQGRFAAGAALLDGRLLDEVDRLRQAPVRLLRRRHPARAPRAVRQVTRPAPATRRRPRRAADALGRRRPGRRGRLDRPARAHRLRGARPAGGRPDPRAAGTRPAAPPAPTAAEPSPGSPAAARAIGALLMDQSVLAGVGNVYRAELLFRHRVSPVPSRPRRRRRAVGGDVGRSGHADARRGTDGPDRHHPARGPVAPRRRGAPGGRALRLPAHRPALPRSAARRCAPR